MRGYALIHTPAWGWRDDCGAWHDEPDGGCCVETGLSLGEAMAALRAWREVAPRIWGPGELVVVDGCGCRVDAETDERAAA